MIKTILQHDQQDCGAACLAIIAAHYGLYYPLSKYRELTKTDSRGCNIYGIIDASQKIGLCAEGLSGSPDEFNQYLAQSSDPFPFIAHTVSSNDTLHYVVVYGYKHGKFLISDPGRGKVKMDYASFIETWTGYIVVFSKTAEFKKGNYKPFSLLKFTSVLKGHYKTLILIIIMSLIVSAIGIISAYIYEFIIDNLDYNNHNASYNIFSSSVNINEYTVVTYSRKLDIVFLSIISLYIIQCLIQFTRGRLLLFLSKEINTTLFLSYFDHILDLPISTVSDRQSGDYMSRIADIDSIRIALSTSTISIFLDAIMAIACGIILYNFNSHIFIIPIVMLILYIIIVLLFKKPLSITNKKFMEHNSIVQSYIKECLDGVITIKSINSEKSAKDTLRRKYNCYTEIAFKGSTLSIIQECITSGIELVGSIIVLWLGFNLIIGNNFTIGELLTYYALLSYFLEPIKNIINLQPEIQTAIIASERLSDIIDLDSENESSSQEMPAIDNWELCSVSFRYKNNELILKDINMSFRRGDRIAIVGESGSGKSTLAKILAGMYSPENGCIKANNINTKAFSIGELRKNITYVAQDTFLFADSIENNLLMGLCNITENDIINVCKLTHSDEFIDLLPLGLKTPLDENGNNLSGGQKQKLSIARALLRKPQLLILDETTSNLDSTTETKILNSIFKHSQNITCIIIAHRLSSIKDCNKIYVMKNGCIIGHGSHEYLMKNNETYAMLWSNQ